MGGVLVGLLPAAIAFAFSPLPVIELILVVFSRRARLNSVVFLVAVALPTFVIPALGATLVKSATDGGSSSSAGDWVALAFAVVLLLIALANLRKYRDEQVPKVFDMVDGMGPWAVLGLAIGVTLANPKNLALLLAAGETMREASLPTGQMLLTVALFALIALVPYLAVVGYRLLGGEKADRRLTAFKGWLLRNNHKIMFWVCLVVGLDMGIRAVIGLVG